MSGRSFLFMLRNQFTQYIYPNAVGNYIVFRTPIKLFFFYIFSYFWLIIACVKRPPPPNPIFCRVSSGCTQARVISNSMETIYTKTTNQELLMRNYNHVLVWKIKENGSSLLRAVRKWFKVTQNGFQHMFWLAIITTLAQSSVNTLSSFTWHNR